jgi:hypothetical protein
MNPSQALILKAAVVRLVGNAPFKALMNGQIFNHIPQERALPCCRVRWSQAGEWDTKDSDGVEGYLFVDIWTDYRGDKVALEAADMAINLFHLAPLVLSDSQSLILRRDFIDSFTEPDGLTHHTAIRFRHIATT